MPIVPLREARDEPVFGGKAVQLGAALRAGLPVPDGFAVSVEALSSLVRGEPAPLAAVEAALSPTGVPVAARSSAVGEDAREASFAGQHATVLNVASPAQLVAALGKVWESAHAEAALAYRKKRGIPGEPRIAAVVQRLVDPTCAGVLFTRNPVTGVRERVVEAAWGLGEGVVAGLVTPDHYRLDPEGRVLEARVGEKDLAIRRAPGGGTVEAPVPEELVHARCLDDGALRSLHELSAACERVFGADLDLEWAFAAGKLFLLQSRPISTSVP